jgi:hypothetical protein
MLFHLSSSDKGDYSIDRSHRKLTPNESICYCFHIIEKGVASITCFVFT